MIRHLVSGLVLSATIAMAGLALAQDKCPRHHGPPPEALAACEDKSQGDSCSFNLGDRSIDGTCEAPPNRKLACRPADMPPPPEGGGTQKMD